MAADDAELMRKLAHDPEQRSRRHAVAGEVAPALSHHGRVLHVQGHVIGDGRVVGKSPRGNGDDRVVAIGYLLQAAGQLLGSVLSLVEDGQAYAAAALSRQLVEIEYLLWAFETDHNDAAVWLNTSKSDRLAMWQPRHLRKRANGRFLSKDYSLHCEIGGHPTPWGLASLFGADVDVVAEANLNDALSHVAGLWRSAVMFMDGDLVDRRLEQFIGDWLHGDDLRRFATWFVYGRENHPTD